MKYTRDNIEKKHRNILLLRVEVIPDTSTSGEETSQSF